LSIRHPLFQRNTLIKIETKRGDAEENIEIKYERIDLEQYINKYPSKKGIYDTFKNALNVSITSICLLAAVLAIYSYFSG